jgi:hypothetical protein
MLLALCVASVCIAGCTLYFDDHRDDNWDDDWSDEDCPSGTTLTYDGYGNAQCLVTLSCSSDADCLAGCYCDTELGYCVEAGFCSSDSDCPPGLECNEARQSCDPDGTSGCTELSCPDGWACDAYTDQCIAPPPPATCSQDNDCSSGVYCNESGTCEDSCYCSSDPDAVNQGWGYCDEDRATCMPGIDPDLGSCAGAVTCNFGAPTCPANQVPLVKDGCYTGECIAASSCDLPPPCVVLNTEALCLGRPECTAVYSGTNCTNKQGTACQSSDVGCTCETYAFDECRAD